MKHIKVYLIAFLVSICSGAFAQYMSMNTSGAAGSPSAILDLSANPNMGFLTPSVTFTSSVDVTTIPSPKQGLIVYNPTSSTSNGLFGPGFYYWSGSQWNYLYNNNNGPAVTSVGLSMPPSIFAVSGSPVTSSGTLGVTLVNQNANLIFAGPSTGSPAAPTFRALTLADLPTGIPNSALAHSSITLSGTGVTFTPSSTVALGGTITVTGTGGTVTSVGPGTEGGTVSGSSGLTFTPNPITGAGTIALAALPVSPAGTYTNTTQVPVIAVNAEGQITSVTPTSLTHTGTVTSVGAGTPGSETGTSGLTFSANPITSTGTIAIATGGVTNTMLANSSVTINTTAPLTGGGSVALGGTLTLGLTTPLADNYGGTGTGTAPTQYGVIYSADGSTYTSTAAGTSGNVLTGNGASAPTYQPFSTSIGGTYIENQTTSQNPGNFWIKTAAAGNVGGVIEAASSQTADLLDFDNSTGTPVAYFNNAGNLTTQALTSTGTANINTTAAGGITTIGAGGTGAVVIGNATGKVGIGTATPNNLLNVNGTAGIGQSSATAGANTGNLTFYNGGNTGSVNISAGSLVSGNSYTMTLPLAQATSAGQVLTNNGSGTLSWVSPLGLYTFNNGITLTGSTLQLGGPLVQSTTVNASSGNYNMNFDLGTGSVAGTGAFSVTNGGSGTPYLYVAGNTSNNVPAVGIGNNSPGSNLLKVSTTAATSGTGNGINISAQTGASGSAGGNVSIVSGTGGNNASGGTVNIAVGASTGNASGGNIVIEPSALNGSGTINGGVVINNEGSINPIPDPSSLVDMQSTSSGLLIPRMTTAQMNAINSPAQGLTVYTTDTYCFMYWTGTAWTQISCACSGAPGTPTTWTGTNSTTVCAGTTNTYSIASVTGASSYYWIIPAGGGTILSGQGTTSISLLMGDTASTTISVFAINGCGSSGQLSETITINPQPSGGTGITGPDTVCVGAGNVFSCPGVTGATTYNWTLPSGWSGSSTTSSITGTASATGSGNITCTPVSGSCTGSTFVFPVTSITTPSAPTNVSGATTACTGSSAITYTCSQPASATSYNWSLSSTNSTSTGITLGVSSTYTNTVTWGGTAAAGTYSVNVTASNSCGTGAAYTWTVTVYGTPTTPSTPTQTPSGAICYNTAYTYSVTAVTGATAYTWTFPSGSQTPNPRVTTTNTISVTYTTYPTCGSVTVVASNAGGCQSPSSAGLAVSVGTTCSQAFTAGVTTPFVIPCGITSITVAIAGGAGGAGLDAAGKAASFTASGVTVIPTHTLEVLVGTAGTAGTDAYSGGGGGASYVWDNSNTTITSPVLIIAGGGGGGAYAQAGKAASTTTTATATTGGAGGTNGNGGAAGTNTGTYAGDGGGGAGAGFISNGAAGIGSTYAGGGGGYYPNASSFAGNGGSGAGYGAGAVGGYGGGGGPGLGGGGGGGYNGGGGGNTGTGGGGGGSSTVNGGNPTGAVATHTGAGSVTITY